MVRSSPSPNLLVLLMLIVGLIYFFFPAPSPTILPSISRFNISFSSSSSSQENFVQSQNQTTAFFIDEGFSILDEKRKLLDLLNTTRLKTKKKPSKFDIVYTYVNGSDPVHLAKKLTYLEQARLNNTYSADVANIDEALSRDNNELMFSLRSVAAHFHWFKGKVFIIADQEPCWLNTSHPQIHMVKLEDFMPSDAVPSFNSHAIEANIHRIKGLAEHYLYFNDDYMIGRSIKIDEFVDDGCLVFFRDERRTLRGGGNNTGWSVHRQAMKNTNKLLDKRFGYRRRYYLPHSPHVFRKSVVRKLVSDFWEVFYNTTRHQFRSWEDVHTAYFFSNYVVEKKPVCGRFKNVKNRCLKNEEHCIKLLHDLNDTKRFFGRMYHDPPHKFVSINDHIPDDSDEIEDVMAMFAAYMWDTYPIPSPWEKNNHCRSRPG
eukprot:TRINITY_DN2788_c0_g1_i1.p1 TRINITY_DN2788_c0_g1~~TRINITY_DN2788_c0_g1_i1.p1  ORF type:complete len:429 (+),score=73.72 TRINITY_DN2788_c0_g1_i1:98-1384(+)